MDYFYNPNSHRGYRIIWFQRCIFNGRKKTIQKRRSVRSYSDEKPSDNIIYEIIKLANLAPSAGNLQSRDFIIIDASDIKKRLSIAAFDQQFIIEAPLNIVVCANQDRIAS